MEKTINFIVEQIKNLSDEKTPVVVAIDGRCASGKTTIAACLQEKLSCEVIHMDDLFLRPEQRTEERLKTPGGNVDYERFLEEVIIPLKQEEAFFYRPYDCHTQTLKAPVEVKGCPVILVEGSYSCHPCLYENYDLHIFLDVDKETQLQRIRLRNGEEMAKSFVQEWIPLEEAYFLVFNIKEKCELKY